MAGAGGGGGGHHVPPFSRLAVNKKSILNRVKLSYCVKTFQTLNPSILGNATFVWKQTVFFVSPLRISECLRISVVCYILGLLE